MNRLLLLATAGFALGAVGAAQALPVQGNVAFDLSSLTNSDGTLSAGDTVSVGGGELELPSEGDFTLALGALVDPFSVTLTLGQTVSVTTEAGQFSGEIVFLQFAQGFANAFARGSFTPDPGGPLGSLSTNDLVEFRFSVNQSGTSFSGGATLDTELTPIPAPAALALFGLGLVGLGVAARRKASV